VVARGTDGLAEVVAEFGDDVLAFDGELDRPALGRMIFGDPARRRALEAIIHPRVRARTAEMIAAAPAGSVVINDVPLLVESGLEEGYDVVLVVEAPEAVRIDRLTRERGMPESEARARIGAQATDAQRRAVADVVIVNDGTLAQLNARVDEVWRAAIMTDVMSGSADSALAGGGESGDD
jgi:dephospho-CoA kinase